jgi:hypothetical protein
VSGGNCGSDGGFDVTIYIDINNLEYKNLENYLYICITICGKI